MNNYSRKQYSNTIIDKNRKLQKLKKRRRKRCIILLYVSILSIILFAEISVIKKDIIPTISTKNTLSSNHVVASSEDNGKNRIKDELSSLLTDYPKIKNIINNIHSYPDEILELVLKNPETIDYAIDYPKNYPANDNGRNITIADDYIEGKIPLFLQWDKRWGYYNYGEAPISLSGCGPTALSMIIVGLTGDTSQNPKVIADFSYEHGYWFEGHGSAWTLMSEGSSCFGLKAKELPLNERTILSTLRNGHPIIAIMGPGAFTTTGHFIVLTGVTDNDKILVNDPNSISRSNMEWDIDVFMNQIQNLWQFSK